MNPRLTGFLIAAVIFFADQMTKWAVTGPLGVNEVGDQLILLPFFSLTFTQNFGISWGFLHADTDQIRWLLVAFTAAIAVGVTYWLVKEKEQWERVALGLVLGGAVGNILDRARLGYVVDFADLNFRSWPQQLCWSYSDGVCRPFLIFNVADAAISIGVVILLLRALLHKKEEPKENHEHA
ncbi:signal peptidase II [Sphingomonas piscis]|uniref:Lipoprotein signal peptidase n=1 Tax=Sphingomonas piscis TaxID=2714943 RepID=A0A6G7YQZ3_9SPHN|nr:signal peptidase II [Sphingomonas piscis]QIK79156.1 signal peptidase II [Sphingomonas piscis]